MQQLLIFCLGAFGYTLLEILWRGYSHWSMSLTGGFCFLMIYLLNTQFPDTHFLLRLCIGTAIITLTEFAVGCVVNLLLGWNVWDYSHLPFNLLGQICPLYTLLWFLLCIPINFCIQQFLI